MGQTGFNLYSPAPPPVHEAVVIRHAPAGGHNTVHRAVAVQVEFVISKF
jgi:hypothetical protein